MLGRSLDQWRFNIFKKCHQNKSSTNHGYPFIFLVLLSEPSNTDWHLGVKISHFSRHNHISETARACQAIRAKQTNKSPALLKMQRNAVVHSLIICKINSMDGITFNNIATGMETLELLDLDGDTSYSFLPCVNSWFSSWLSAVWGSHGHGQSPRPAAAVNCSLMWWWWASSIRLLSHWDYYCHSWSDICMQCNTDSVYLSDSTHKM